MSKSQRLFGTVILGAVCSVLLFLGLRGLDVYANAPQTPDGRLPQTLPDGRERRDVNPVVNDREQAMRVVRALRENGVHAAAIASGGRYITEYDLNPDVTFNGIDQLAWTSALVVVGRPVSATSRISVDGKRVLTRFVVQTDETLKGISPGSVFVDVLGGRFEFSDGAVAEASTPGFQIELGGRYLLFLQTDRSAVGNSDRGPFLLTNGTHGVVNIGESDSRVRSMARQRMPFDGENVASFLARARTLTLTAPRDTVPIR